MKCGCERVEVTHATLQEMINTIHPTINSIPQHVIDCGRDAYAICPRCDTYALGIEMEKGFLFTDRHGNARTIHDLGDP